MSGLLHIRGPPCSRVTAFGGGEAAAVWLGRGAAAQDHGLLTELGVTHVLNVADDVPNFHAGDPALTYCALEVGDFGADAGISRVFAKAHAFAQAALDGGNCLLVHCANGSNRSATVVLALLMQMTGRSLRDSWLALLADRPNVFPLKDNQRELIAFEQRLFDGASSMEERDFGDLKQQDRKQRRQKSNLNPKSTEKEDTGASSKSASVDVATTNDNSDDILIQHTRIFVSVGYLGASVSAEQHLAQGSRLGQLYQSVTNCLLRRGPLFCGAPPLGKTRWRRLKQLKGTRFPQLILGGACGFGIPFKRLSASASSSLASSRGRPATLVNYYRGFETVCRKAKLVETLRHAYPDAAARGEWLPESFVFCPARPEQSEVAQFRAAFAKDTATRGRSLWILKPSDGSKGREIFVTDREEEVLATFATEEVEADKAQAKDAGGGKKDYATSRRRTGTIAWVVQRYITNPLLLSGGRKFDMRVWVLVDADFRIFVHREGVLRTTSVPFSLAVDSLDNAFVHLSNHCIQTKCPSYGQYEPTNEMFYDEFDAHLSRMYRVRVRSGCAEADVAFGRGEFDARRVTEEEKDEDGDGNNDGNGPFHRARLREVLVPQMHRIAAMTLMSAKDQMCNAPGAAFASFNLFGFDFMVDDSLRVQLIEINSSPAVADRLLKEVTQDLCEAAIAPFFAEGGAKQGSVESGGFERVDCAKWVSE